MFVDFFIRRPVLSIVSAILIVLAGVVSIPLLPISKFPQLAPPEIVVTSVYTGASAEVVETTVTTPLEVAINGVEGMRYMRSTSGDDGTSQITITFEIGRDEDLAAVDVQNRISTVLPRLPAQVNATGVTVTKRSSAFVLAIGLYAPTGQYDSLFLSNYADVYMVDALKRVPGVGEARVFGERKYAMRIWLDPTRMASRDLTAADVLAALREQNVSVGAGAVGQEPAPDGQEFQITVDVEGRLADAAAFGSMILKADDDGTLVLLRDVGRAEVGAETYATRFRFNGHEGVGIGIFQLSSANALEVEQGIQTELARLARSFPPGMQYAVAFNPTEFVAESINEVLVTLAEAIVLVILVIFFFLQSWRSTLIPAVAIPVSLVGTFAFLNVFGFSINTLTLFGIVLATGLVVDDAIVVVENIERHIRERGESPREAASRGMKEIASAVVAMSVVLVAVFVPVAFFPGTTGRLYNQFALTIASSIAISAFVALTLTPALAALLLRAGHGPGRGPFGWINRGIAWVTSRFAGSLGGALRFRLAGLLVFVGALALTAWIYRQVPTGFVPDEDQGYFIVNVQTPPGASLQYTDDAVAKVEAVLSADPDIAGIFAPIGFSFSGNGANRATVFPTLKPLEERTRRDQEAGAVITRVRDKLAGIPEAVIVPFPPPPVPGIGSLGGFQFFVQDPTGRPTEWLAAATGELIGEANQRPDLRGVFTSFTANDPKLRLEIDRLEARSLGVPISEITAALQVYMGSQYVNDFTFNNRSYRVYAQSEGEYRAQPRDLDQFYVRGQGGQSVPLASLVTFREVTGPQTITHYNLFRAAELNGAPAPGYSSGQAIEAMETLAGRILPAGMSFEWSGITVEEIEAGGAAFVLFALGVLFVFLVLAAQYESFVLPLIILLAVPVATLGALGAQGLRGLTNDVYCQIGLVMLVGLATKNAILIVEFAEQLRKEGMALYEAAREAARLRFRPILMTSLAFILGLLPLVFASGAGQESRWSLGTTVLGGMVVSTVLNLYLIPVLYVSVQSFRDTVRRGLFARVWGRTRAPSRAVGSAEALVSPSPR